MATQILPVSQPHFVQNSPYNTEMLSQFSDYGNVQGANFPFYLGQTQHPQPYLSESNTLSPEIPYIRRSSQSPNPQMRMPRSNDRTPIQRHQSNFSRIRSQSRPEILLAYANEQESLQAQQSSLQPVIDLGTNRSTPTTPSMFPMQSYSSLPTGSGSVVEANTYFPPPPATHQNALLAEYNFRPEQNLQPIFSIDGNVAPVPGVLVAGFSAQDSVYMPSQNQTSPPTMPSLVSVAPSFPPVQTLESTPAEFEIATSRPRPQCWDHGCNGRQFSTFSNLLRHQREKSGNAMKALCPHCGTEFTRTTARNGHMYGGKCKGRPDNENSGTLGSGERDLQDL